MNRIDALRAQLEEMPPAELAPARWYLLGRSLSVLEPFHEAWLTHEGEDVRIRLARAQAAEMAAARPVIKPRELLIGDWGLNPIMSGRATPFGNGVRLNHERAAALKEHDPGCAGAVDAIVSYWESWLAAHPDCRGLTCHASLAYERVIEMGLDGLREYVLSWRATTVPGQPEADAWYAALVITVDGISAFIQAHAGAARELSARTQDAERRAELEHIADGCRHIAHGPPRSFHEAVQLFYLVFLLCGHDSPGPIDRTLWPPLQRDLAEGTITLDEAQELVDCLWLKLAEKTAYGATLGGQRSDGTDACNELSFLCLSSIQRLRLLSPRTAVRWHAGLSSDFLARACEVVADGASFPALVNDEAMIAAAIERGISLEHARDYTFVGCGQTFPHGRGHGNYEDVILNAAKPFELALHNGVDPMTGQRIGPETGAPAEMRTYEQFETAYRRQMDAMISERIHAINERRRATAGHAYDFLRSLLTHSCVERGLDWHAGGADYSEGMVDVVGLTTVTDSLVAVQQGVFEKQAISLPKLVEVLDANWDGEEALRQYFLRQLPKFGNGSPDADAMAASEAVRINGVIKSHSTFFGGPWGMDIIGWSGAVVLGEQTGATPDGRHRGEALADCAGPAQGRNVMGLTPTLNSVLALPHRHCHGPLALSLRFPAKSVSTGAGRRKLRAMIETYFRQGGQQLQISIASTDEMKAAQSEPEKHRDLIVRVGGFSAYFTQLDKRWQDDMIARSEAQV